MDDQTETWRRRIRELYANVEELFSHIDITVVIFDRDLEEVRHDAARPAIRLQEPLVELARRVLETGEPQRDVALDEIGRQRIHGFPLRERDSIHGVVVVIDDDGARRELFVRCAMALFDGYCKNEAELLERERHALEEAKQANRLRDRFLAVVAHELRSPMASILLWEQVLRHDELDAVTRAAALDAIHASATGQALLVADLVDVSRAMNGKLHIERVPTSITRVLEMAIESARRVASLRDVEIVSDLDDDLGDVLGDSRRLRQIFDNLLANALKWTERGRVSVRSWRDADSINVEVRDTGRGITAAFLPHLFEPFRQADESEKSEGLGLGLGIARDLVELHGGTLTAWSEGIGHGSQFTVTLPRILRPVPEEPLTRPSIAGIRLLIVEDDVQILEALEHLLRAAGAIVATATSARTAYAIVQLGNTDILLSDIGMPGEDGHDLVQRLRNTEGPVRLTPAIAITARVSEDSRERALAAGFDRYMTKPIDVDLLVSTIGELAALAGERRISR